MFTGIVQSLGEISALVPTGEDMRLSISCAEMGMDDVALGDSISINGVCLTVTELQATEFCAYVSGETLSCTTFAQLQVNDRVNIEKALLPTTRLGGHLVSGHVDGIATVVSTEDDAKSRRIRFSVPQDLSRYIAAKGSVCVDGVSLTVNVVEADQFEVNIIPHTLQQTVIGNYKAKMQVNIEVDIIARYLERLLCKEGTSAAPNLLDFAFLSEHGFAGK